MNWYLYRLELKPPYDTEEGFTEAAEAIAMRHFAYLTRLRDEGVLALAGRTDYETHDPRNHGIAIFKAEDDAAARALMEGDPAVAEGLMKATLHPYRLALFGPDAV